MFWPLKKAVYTLKTSGVIAYPTEAVWGLGCDPYDEEALSRIVQIKQRDMKKGMLLVASDIKQIEYLLHGVDDAVVKKMADSWRSVDGQPQRSTTWLVPHRGLVQELVHGQYQTVALRVSQHPVVKAMCEQFGGPVVSTSANFSGHEAARNINQVRKFLGHEVDFILPGDIGGQSKPSRIIDAISDRVLRD